MTEEKSEPIGNMKARLSAAHRAPECEERNNGDRAGDDV
jgi:hypothetical protein